AGVECGASDAETQCAGHYADLRENRAEIAKAAALRAQKIFGRDANVIEQEFCRLGGARAKFVDRLADLQTGCSALDEEQVNPFEARVGIGLGGNGEKIGAGGTRYPHLLPVDDPSIAV